MKNRVIIKLDDLRSEKMYFDAFKKLYTIITELKIKVAIGITKTDEILETDEKFQQFVKEMLKDSNIEIWQHGHFHKKNNENGEYRGTSEEEQFKYLNKAQQNVKKLFQIIPSTFGAPFNHTDKNTNLAILKEKNIKRVFFMENRNDGLIYLNNRVNMENGTGILDFNYFKENLNKAEQKDYIVLQGHPHKWFFEDELYKEFIKIVFYLKELDYKFIKPNEIK